MGASRVSFASGDETKALTGMLIGGVTIFALPPELPIYGDERVMAPDWIIVGGGGRPTKIKLAPVGLRRLPRANFVPGPGRDLPGRAACSQLNGSAAYFRLAPTSRTRAPP